MRAARVIVTASTVAAMTTGLIGLTASESAATAGDEWTVVNTGGIGVLSRSAAFHDASYDYGPAEGESVVDVCQVMDGDAEGAYGNRVWHFVHTQHSGDIWIADTYLNTPNVANEPTPGTPFCTSNTGTPGVATGEAQPTAASADAPSTNWAPNCSGNDYVTEVTVTPFPSGQWQINVTPTDNVRSAYFTGYRREATDAIWHAVQACVSGLYGDLADSIYEQIDCHVGYAYMPGRDGHWATGPTFDLESWRPAVGDVADEFYLVTHCGWGGYPYGHEPSGAPYRPDAGALDLGTIA